MKKILFLITGMFTSSLAWSQSPHTLLWRISGKQITHPSYLFGTMHVLCARDAVLSDSLKAAIAHCDKIYFEINLNDMMSMLGAGSLLMMKDNQTLSGLLKADEYTRVKNYFAQHVAIPFIMLERFKPMLVGELVEEQAMDCDTKDGMEMQILKESKRYNKPVDGLETIEFQAGLLDSIPYTEQAKELLNSIDSAAQNKETTRQLVDLYKKQDLDGIDSLSHKDDGGVESNHMDLFLYNRNRKWAKMLDTMLNQRSLLIAVGAAHLPGKNGVIDLLRKEGYTVEPVPNQVPNGQVAKLSAPVRPTQPTEAKAGESLRVISCRWQERSSNE